MHDMLCELYSMRSCTHLEAVVQHHLSVWQPQPMPYTIDTLSEVCAVFLCAALGCGSRSP
jgi:hypothetical protein